MEIRGYGEVKGKQKGNRKTMKIILENEMTHILHKEIEQETDNAPVCLLVLKTQTQRRILYTLIHCNWILTERFRAA